MKTLMIATTLFVSFSSFAIEFFTEKDVQLALGADKVIEISRYIVQDLANNDCGDDVYSRSGRAYIVKKGEATMLYSTPESIKSLKKCKSVK